MRYCIVCKKWSQEEVDFLKNNYHQYDAGYFAKKFGRTLEAIRAKIKKIEVPRKKAKNWTQSEVKFLKDNYSLYSWKELSVLLDRPILGIADKATNLKLKRKVLHHKSEEKLYHTWARMRSRCNLKKNKDYNRYGGRGIKVCEEWNNGVLQFYNWAMESGYREGLTIERINNDGDYSPENCRWATRYEQAQNLSTTRFITCWGEIKSISDWSKDSRCIVSKTTLKSRIDRDWEEIQALTLPKTFKREIQYA